MQIQALYENSEQGKTLTCTLGPKWEASSRLTSFYPVWFAAEAPKWSGEVWRWKQPAAGGGRAAAQPAAVSKHLRGRRSDSQLPKFTTSFHHRVGKLYKGCPCKVQHENTLNCVLKICCPNYFFLLNETQERSSSHPRVRNWFGCYLCFLWSVLQPVLSSTRLRWATTHK